MHREKAGSIIKGLNLQMRKGPKGWYPEGLSAKPSRSVPGESLEYILDILESVRVCRRTIFAVERV